MIGTAAKLEEEKIRGGQMDSALSWARYPAGRLLLSPGTGSLGQTHTQYALPANSTSYRYEIKYIKNVGHFVRSTKGGSDET
jgi:hypothetical protein